MSDALSGVRVLVVDDSATLREHVANLLEAHGAVVDSADSGRRALALLEAGAAPDVVMLDVRMPSPDGLATLARIREEHPSAPVVMLSSDGKASTIVEAIRRGASDFLTKPPAAAALVEAVQRVVASRAREARYSEFQANAHHPEGLWNGPSLRSIRDTIEQVADTDVTILIQGESGVGKEVAARRVHERSARAAGPFVKVNCAALPGDLLESELFGYEKSAFTGATGRRAGRFELANGGTIFLDEIGEMSAPAQAKVLHVLQDASFYRVGGNDEIHVDVRVVTASNRPLDQEVARGRFREDLYFRLNVVALHLPALRDRGDEIGAMIDFLLERSAARYKRPVPELSQELRARFATHPFPGNIRELENYLKRIVVLGSETQILDELAAKRGAAIEPPDFEDLLEEVEATAGDVPLREVGRIAAEAAEQRAIRHALARTDWNRRQAAQLLGVSYKTLLQKIRQGDLAPD